ncbi:MAG: CBS domain-containing protein [Candidatus Omnitrophica bacterium]|nr:CBS domain-containing protein [Candidatus Omnitrophota bacterium]
MRVKNIMSHNPVCCTADTALDEAARMMHQHNCGALPVVDNLTFKKPLGMITDRDIACRGIAQGKNTADLRVRDCMTNACVTVTPETSLHDCCLIMERNRIRRAPVVDESGACCGVVSQADVARHASYRETGELLREVSHI